MAKHGIEKQDQFIPETILLLPSTISYRNNRIFLAATILSPELQVYKPLGNLHLTALLAYCKTAKIKKSV